MRLNSSMPIRDPREQKIAECDQNAFLAGKAGLICGVILFLILWKILLPFIDLNKTQTYIGVGFSGVIGAVVGVRLVYRHYRIHHGL